MKIVKWFVWFCVRVVRVLIGFIVVGFAVDWLFGEAARRVMPVAFAAVLFAEIFGSRLWRHWKARRTKGPSDRSLDQTDRAALFERPQGLLAGAILVAETSVGSDRPSTLVAENIAFVNWAMEDALLIPGEFPEAAMMSYHVDYYLAQVNNGGHRQFAFNSRMPPSTIDNIAKGLAAMGATDFLAVFQGFVDVMRSDPELAAVITGTVSFTPPPPSIKAMDEAFFGLRGTERLIGQNAAWLRGLAVLKPCSIDAMASEKAVIKAKNRLFGARQAQFQVDRETILATDPVRVAARQLCAAAGLTFEAIVMGQPSLSGAVSWTIRTSLGTRTMVLGSQVAVLLDQDGKTPLARIDRAI